MNAAVNDWRNNPFEPFRIARLRPIAFKKNAFMKLMDALIACGDYYYMQDTIESINIAELYYVTAAEHLGPAAQTLPPRNTPTPMSYNDLMKAGGPLDAFSNALVLLENEFPFVSGVAGDPTSSGASLLGVSRSLFFCIPKMRSCWRIGIP